MQINIQFISFWDADNILITVLNLMKHPEDVVFNGDFEDSEEEEDEDSYESDEEQIKKKKKKVINSNKKLIMNVSGIIYKFK